MGRAFLPLALLLTGGVSFAADKVVIVDHGDVVTGRCVAVHDGDSMTVLIDTADGPRQVKVRLDAIDAPELGQPYSRRSRQALADLVFNRECRVESRGPDKYRRTIGRVVVDGVSVNETLLDLGMAWHYSKYDDRASMAARQAAARAAKVGLWQDASAVPPWEWRAMSKEARLAARLQVVGDD